uniref:Uncharacterized protein n=1 Tax=Meloidogyne enterolobii TaxID=390850 RepID=A0A6V7UHW3_MELEN|nr:unnamed protein product [Meloidogyne enterolobii]
MSKSSIAFGFYLFFLKKFFPVDIKIKLFSINIASMTSLMENNLIDNINMLSINTNSNKNGIINQHSSSPFSPTLKRIVKAEEAKEKRRAFKQTGGKSRSLGNSETLSTTITNSSMASSPSRSAGLMGRSESVSRHSINLNNDKKNIYLTPKSSGNPSPSHLAVPKSSGQHSFC